MLKQYPEDQEKYSNKEKLNKDRVAAKLKTIMTGYRKVCDNRRKSGGCRIVFTFYGLCENLWGGSPAVTSLSNATDSPLQDQLLSTNFVNKFPHDLSPVQPAAFEDEEEEFEGSVETSTLSEEITKPREVSELLKNRKDKKMTSRINTGNQLLQLTREGIAFKKQMLEKMEKSDHELRTELANLNQVMSNIGSLIQQSIGILDQLLSNQSRGFPPPTPFHHARDFLPNVYARDFLPNGQPTSTSILVEPQPSSQESVNVNEDRSQKNYYNFN